MQPVFDAQLYAQKKLKRKLRAKYKEKEDKMNCAKNVPLAPMAVTQFTADYAVVAWDECCANEPKQEKEHNMGYDINLEADAKKHLRRRAEGEFYSKIREAQAKYHILEEHPASTKDEILAALKAGEIEFEDYNFDKDGRLKAGYSVSGTFGLKNPKTDNEGYKTASKVIEEAYTDLTDAIVVKSSTDGLEALKAFKALQV